MVRICLLLAPNKDFVKGNYKKGWELHQQMCTHKSAFDSDFIIQPNTSHQT